MGSGWNKPAPTAIETTSPKSVLQVFHNVVSYGKVENNASARAALCRWPDELLSHSGEASGETLHLQSGLLDDRPRFERSDLLILNDYSDPAAAWARVPLHEESDTGGVSLMQLGSRVVDYEIFQLRRGGSGLELHLAYARHAAYIGAPRRGDYRIARLEPGQTLRVTINGKLDFSASGRRARSYQVRDYLFQHLGNFSRFLTHPTASPGTLKKLALAGARHIDLRKILY